MMTVKRFREEVLSEVGKMLGEDVKIIQHEVLKTNGVMKTGICITQSSSNTGPILYWEDLQTRTMDVEKAARELYDIYQSTKDNINDTWMELFMDWNLAKETVCIRVMNLERNRELIKGLPYWNYLNLVAVPYLEICSGDYVGSALIRKEMLEVWKISEEELKAQAWQNMKKLPCRWENLEEMMKNMLRTELEAEGLCEEEIAMVETKMGLNVQNAPEMYVVQLGMGGVYNRFGAAAILNPDNFAFLKKDCWILPSSVHELIVVPYKGELGDELKEMVRSINLSDVKESEILSDQIYLYHYDSNTLELI